MAQNQNHKRSFQVFHREVYWVGPLIFLVLIGDIDENVIHCLVKSFADDTRAAKSIKNAEDVKILQQELQILYQWTIANNMKLNDAKFELLRYGLNAQIKEDYTTLHQQEIKLKQKTLLKILEF